MKTFLLQGVTQDNHLDAITDLLQIPDPEKVIICVGFMTESGLVALESALRPVAERTTIIAGIRNGITSAQGLRKSLEIGCKTYVVDTGSRDILFHPKVYLSRNSDEVRLVIGSANLTASGLTSNIESSLSMQSSLTTTANSSLASDLETKIDRMIADYPQHIFQIADVAMIDSLLDSGRLVDESERSAPTTSGSSTRRNLDYIPRMNLNVRSIARHRPQPMSTTSSGEAVSAQPTLGGVAPPIPQRSTLMWRSKPLLRRHLSIPTGANTNPTGSMLFGKGDMDQIDHRHYFRDKVFDGLAWQFDVAAGKSHLERAEARFKLVIRDVNYGVFTLRLTHNSRTNTAAYRQRNSMTQVHWGEARRVIAHDDLLGRTMYLYRDAADPELFVLEID